MHLGSGVLPAEGSIHCATLGAPSPHSSPSADPGSGRSPAPACSKSCPPLPPRWTDRVMRRSLGNRTCFQVGLHTVPCCKVVTAISQEWFLPPSTPALGLCTRRLRSHSVVQATTRSYVITDNSPAGIWLQENAKSPNILKKASAEISAHSNRSCDSPVLQEASAPSRLPRVTHATTLSLYALREPRL